MHKRDIVVFSSGGFLVLAMILACDGDSPADSDAGTCDCAAAEAPLMGRIQLVENTTMLSPANMGPFFGKDGGGAECPSGGFLLSGGCAAALGASPDVILEQSFPAGTNAWICRWQNLTNDSVPVRGMAKCLMPVQ